MYVWNITFAAELQALKTIMIPVSDRNIFQIKKV